MGDGQSDPGPCAGISRSMVFGPGPKVPVNQGTARLPCPRQRSEQIRQWAKDQRMMEACLLIGSVRMTCSTLDTETRSIRGLDYSRGDRQYLCPFPKKPCPASSRLGVVKTSSFAPCRTSPHAHSKGPISHRVMAINCAMPLKTVTIVNSIARS